MKEEIMHSYHGKKGTVFHYNSDFSGNSIIIYDDKEIEIPSSDILELVAYQSEANMVECRDCGWRGLYSSLDKDGDCPRCGSCDVENIEVERA